MLQNRSIRSSAVLGALVLGLTTAVVTSASAARRDTTIALALAVRPPVTALHQPVTVYVTEIDQGSYLGFETVTVQFKECGLSPTRFRDAVEVPPTSHVYPDAGNWIVVITPVASGTFRATIGPSVVSNEMRVLTRAHVRLAPASRGRYRAEVEARLSFRRKSVRIERYDRGRSRWVPLRTVVLNRTDRVEDAGIKYVWSRSDEFAPKVPAGTKLRAVFPLSQAKPCYAAGGSQVLQT